MSKLVCQLWEDVFYQKKKLWEDVCCLDISSKGLWFDVTSLSNFMIGKFSHVLTVGPLMLEIIIMITTH